MSTKVPFKGTSKEYIGDDKEGGIIHETVKETIIQCCRQLKKRIHQQTLLKEQEERKKNLFKYVPNVSRAIFSTLQMIVENKSDQEIRKHSLLLQLNQKKLNEKSLSKALETYIQKIDADAAIEFASSQGSHKQATEDVFIPLNDLSTSTRCIKNEATGVYIILPNELKVEFSKANKSS